MDGTDTEIRVSKKTLTLGERRKKERKKYLPPLLRGLEPATFLIMSPALSPLSHPHCLPPLPRSRVPPPPPQPNPTPNSRSQLFAAVTMETELPFTRAHSHQIFFQRPLAPSCTVNENCTVLNSTRSIIYRRALPLTAAAGDCVAWLNDRGGLSECANERTRMIFFRR